MSKLIKKAKEYAINKHDRPSESQRYGNQPYSKHLNDVVEIVKKYKYLLDDEEHEDVICSSHLHDTVEDTETTPFMLKKMFNERIAKIVFNVSNERGWTKKEQLFKTLPKIWSCKLSTFVKLCDRIANGRNSKNSTSDKSKRMYKRYSEEYPIFRHALITDNNFCFGDMWKELDEIFEWKD